MGVAGLLRSVWLLSPWRDGQWAVEGRTKKLWPSRCSVNQASVSSHWTICAPHLLSCWGCRGSCLSCSLLFWWCVGSLAGLHSIFLSNSLTTNCIYLRLLKCFSLYCRCMHVAIYDQDPQRLLKCPNWCPVTLSVTVDSFELHTCSN